VLNIQRTPGAAATGGRTTDTHAAVPMDDHSRAALVADIKRQLKLEMGLLPVSLLRERRASFVEMHSYDSTGRAITARRVISATATSSPSSTA
jgi:hypothetical protein